MNSEPTPYPTVISHWAKLMAVGTLQHLKSQGIHVPQQILLTGHGNSDMAGVTTPAITTIRYFYEESGADGADLLLAQIRDPEAPAKEIKLGYSLVERESTGPQPGRETPEKGISR